jgi:hypothetical protein
MPRRALAALAILLGLPAPRQPPPPPDARARLWQTGYGDLVNVAFGEGPGELAGWPEADYTIAAVEVFAGAATLYSATDVLVEGNASGPRDTTFAFDRFGQTVVPEPGTAALLLCGLASAAAMRRGTRSTGR